MATGKRWTDNDGEAKAWPQGDRMFDPKVLRQMLRHRIKDPYEWYVRDLRRKRSNRKKKRNLYQGTLRYRRRVGQPEKTKRGMPFRGAATVYDRLRIRMLHEHPEIAKKMPDLFTRYLGIRFPPIEFQHQLLNVPRRNDKMKIALGMMGGCCIRIPDDMRSLLVTPCTEDTREPQDAPSDAVDALALKVAMMNHRGKEEQRIIKNIRIDYYGKFD